MKKRALLIIASSLLFEGCSLLPGSYNAGYGRGWGYSNTNSVIINDTGQNYEYEGTDVVPVELRALQGENLELIDRMTFMKNLKESLRYTHIHLQRNAKVYLTIHISKYPGLAKKHLEVRNNRGYYILDQYFDIDTEYKFVDAAGHNALNGRIRFHKNYHAETDASYIYCRQKIEKQLFTDLARRVAQDMNSKASVLVRYYNTPQREPVSRY